MRSCSKSSKLNSITRKTHAVCSLFPRDPNASPICSVLPSTLWSDQGSWHRKARKGLIPIILWWKRWGPLITNWMRYTRKIRGRRANWTRVMIMMTFRTGKWNSKALLEQSHLTTSLSPSHSNPPFPALFNPKISAKPSNSPPYWNRKWRKGSPICANSEPKEPNSTTTKSNRSKGYPPNWAISSLLNSWRTSARSWRYRRALASY